MLDYSNRGAGSALGADASASASELQAIKDNMSKTAAVLDQVSKAILALRDQVAKLEADFAEVRPQIVAFKVHTESFPQALREARRSDNAVLKTVEGLEERLRELEARLNGHQAAQSPAKEHTNPRPGGNGVKYTHTQFPALRQEHITDNARLFATRHDLVAALGRRGGIATELGVAAGDFSEFILQTLEPKKFYGLDLFDMHKVPVIWGRPSSELFNNMTQLENFRCRFAKYGSRVEARVGKSAGLLSEFPDGTFDFIYVDAGHDYGNVRLDAFTAYQKIKGDGLIVFNDYTLFDPFTNDAYGVIQAVNELVSQTDCRICGFALEHNMFCDIAVRRG